MGGETEAMTSRKQSILLAELAKTGELTLNRAVELVGGYWNNERQWTGAILSRMVKRGLIERVRPGLFILKPKTPREPDPVLILQ